LLLAVLQVSSACLLASARGAAACQRAARMRTAAAAINRSGARLTPRPADAARPLWRAAQLRARRGTLPPSRCTCGVRARAPVSSGARSGLVAAPPTAGSSSSAAGGRWGSHTRPAARGGGPPLRGWQCVPSRRLGMLAALQSALGLGDDASTKALETHRADILAARSTQASAKLRRLLRRDTTAAAWQYFAELCAGPDINEFHCSIMLSAAASPEEVQRVIDMAGRAGVQPNAAVYV